MDDIKYGTVGFAIFVLFCWLLFAFDVLAGGRFTLHKPINETAILVCASADVPIRSNTLAAAARLQEALALVDAAIERGECAPATLVSVTYTKQVHRIDDAGGHAWTVYEGHIGRVPFYVPMFDYLHDEISI